MQPTIHKSNPSPNIVLLEIDNPPANSLSKVLKIRFNELLAELEEDKTVRAVIITGRGNKFCSGDDLKEASKNAQIKGGILENLNVFGELMDRIEALEIPVIAAINGWCIGGGFELALCCDIRLAAEEAKFITAGVNVGLTASGYRLPRLIGIGRAKHLLLTGKAIDTKKAELYGLVTAIYEKSALLPAAIELANLIASKAPLAIKATKRIVNQALDLDDATSKPIMHKEITQLALSDDHREALQAFGEKRKPIFKGQ